MNNGGIVFLCGSRDFHAMDWYRSALKVFPGRKILLLTDLIESEGYKKLINNEDSIHKLIVIDLILCKKQSYYCDKWRNIIKLIVLPFQVFLLHRFSKKNVNYIFHAHSMYYMLLASLAGLKYYGFPQGSDILIKPWKSHLYKIFSKYAIIKAQKVIVDSSKMADGILKIANTEAIVVQNGINIPLILNLQKNNDNLKINRDNITSFRGLTSLYNIDKIFIARNSSYNYNHVPINLIYPFSELSYNKYLNTLVQDFDINYGRLDKEELFNIFYKTLLAISIPSSDSSPRSVYEAIFCGAAVALTYHPFIDELPTCMKQRIILIDTNENNWFDSAVKSAVNITSRQFTPSKKALIEFDQFSAIKKIDNI